MNLYSDATWTLLLLCAGFLLAGTAARRPAHRAAISVVLAVLIFIFPAGDATLAGHLKGLLFEPSIGCILIFTWMVLARINKFLPPPQQWPPKFQDNILRSANQDLNALLIAVLMLSCAVYPMALGISRFDPYALGYQPWAAAAAAFIALLLIWIRKIELIAWWLSLSALANALKLGESDNLLDYLLDPVALAAALIWTAGESGKFILQRFRSAAGK